MPGLICYKINRVSFILVMHTPELDLENLVESIV